MSNEQKLVIINTRGLDDERSSVAWSIANGGIKSGQEVTVFLTASAVDWVRKGAADRVHLNPIDPPIREMIQMVRDLVFSFLGENDATAFTSMVEPGGSIRPPLLVDPAGFSDSLRLLGTERTDSGIPILAGRHGFQRADRWHRNHRNARR